MMEYRQRAQQSEQQGTSGLTTVRDPSPVRRAQETLSFLRWQNLPAYHAQLVLFERDPEAVLSQAGAGREREALREVYQSEVKQERQRLAWEREAPQREKQARLVAQQQRLEEQRQEHRQAKQAATVQRRQNERQANEAKGPQVKAERAKQRASQQPTRTPTKLAQQLLPFLEGTTRRELERAQKFLNNFTTQTRAEVLKLIVHRHPLEVEHLLYGLSGDQMETLLRSATQAKQDLGLLPKSQPARSEPAAAKPVEQFAFAVFRPGQAKTPAQPKSINVEAVVTELVQLSQLGGASGAAVRSELSALSPEGRAAVLHKLQVKYPPVYKKLAPAIADLLPKPEPPVDPVLDEAVDVLLKLRISLNNSGGHQVDVGKNSFGIQPSFNAEMAYRSVMSRVDAHELALLYHEQSGYSFERDFGPLRASYQRVQGALAASDAYKRLDLGYEACLEQLALDVGYADGRLDNTAGMDKQDVSAVKARMQLLRHLGLRPYNAVAGTSGFEMRVLLPIPKGEQGHSPTARPVVVFRGTEGSKTLDLKEVSSKYDWRTDFGDPQVGQRQFRENHELIRFWMRFAHEHGAPVVIGHSLGGALAQMASCAYPEYAGRIVTFQAPGVDQRTLDSLKHFNAKYAGQGRAIESTHYRYGGDIVERAGEQYTPGWMHHLQVPGAWWQGPAELLAGGVGLGVGLAGGMLASGNDARAGRVWDAVTAPLRGAGRTAKAFSLLPSIGQHTLRGVTSTYLGMDPGARALFGDTKGVFEGAKVLNSTPTNDMDGARFEDLRKSLAPGMDKTLGAVIYGMDRAGAVVDTGHPAYVKAHQKLSEIARESPTEPGARALMEQYLASATLFPKDPQRNRRYIVELRGRLGQLWQNWHPEAER